MKKSDKEFVLSGLEALGSITNSFINLAQEKEITKRKNNEYQANMKELDNQHQKILSEEKIELAKIETEFKIGYKNLENESEKTRLQARIIEKMLSLIERYILMVDQRENAYGMNDPRTIELNNNLHQLSMGLTNQISLKGE